LNDNRESWSGRTGFILATIGSAVGLGSIWKFPYEVGANGGTAFVFFYLAGLVLIVVPLMFAEFAIGRRGRGDAAASIRAVAAEHGAGRGWALAGLLGIITGFIILSFYSVIGGWTIAYALETLIHGLPPAEPEAVQARFDALLGSPLRLTIFHAVFMAATAGVVVRGIHGGIEAASKLLMPLLILLMLLLALYGIVEGDAAATLRFLFRLDPRHLTAQAAIEALGLGFFSIGVGMSLMITYAAYAPAGISLKQVAVVSAVADTAISFLAGFAVFPIVFSHGLDPASGAGLVFVTLPLAFADMPYGTAAAFAFFVLLLVAALASAISMLELTVALLRRRTGWSRPKAGLLAAGVCFLAGLSSVFSFNLWAAWHPLAALPAFAESTLFDLLDYLTSNILLPVGGLALALFAGWALPHRLLAEELSLPVGAALWLHRLLRYVVPAGIAAAALLPFVV
jgi:NSS family neurotransmitter:Na+ symporter